MSGYDLMQQRLFYTVQGTNISNMENHRSISLGFSLQETQCLCFCTYPAALSRFEIVVVFLRAIFTFDTNLGRVMFLILHFRTL